MQKKLKHIFMKGFYFKNKEPLSNEAREKLRKLSEKQLEDLEKLKQDYNK